MKTVTLYRPSVFENAFHDVDQYMASFFGESPLAPARRIFSYLPVVDLREHEGAYILEAELPGYDEKSIHVHVDGSTLTIESKKEEESQKEVPEKQAYIVQERRRSSFSRSFKLPETADPEQVSATFKNGVLTLEIKKRSAAQKRMIPIEKQ